MTIKLELKKSGLLYFIDEFDKKIEVYIKSCFPWSADRNFLSLRDLDDNEICLIEDVNELDNQTRIIIEAYLSQTDFIIEINGIVDISEEIELRKFIVKTKQGERIFYTNLDDWPTRKDNGQFLFKDLSGDIYSLNSIDHLSKNELKMILPYTG